MKQRSGCRKEADNDAKAKLQRRKIYKDTYAISEKISGVQSVYLYFEPSHPGRLRLLTK